jgi:colicin import membrane protein
MISESTMDSTERLDGSKWGLMLAISIFLHLLILSAAIFFSGLFTSKENGNVVYEVDLVDLPATGTQAQAPAAIKSEAPAAKVIALAKKTAPVEEKKIPIPAEKTPLNKKTPPVKKEENPNQVINTAIAKLQKKVKAEGGEHLDQAISDLEKKTKTEENHLGNAMAKLQNNVGGTASKNVNLGRLSGSTIMDFYAQVTVKSQIQGNWSYPAARQSSKDLEVTVLLKIREDGTILSYDLTKKSKDKLFDESVLKAIERSKPLPSFPEGSTISYEEFKINFTLKDLLEKN